MKIKRKMIKQFFLIIILITNMIGYMVLPLAGKEDYDKKIEHNTNIAVLPFFKGKCGSSNSETLDSPEKRRIGGSLATSRSASVGFTICLIDVPTGEVLWKGSFEESQKSLSENLLDIKGFLKKDAKWVTADDLTRYGIRELLKKFYRGEIFDENK